MPKCFRLYPNTRVIIDCTELYIQKSRNPKIQSATYSTYKSSNTFKVLLGITPSGAFSFVSKLWTGNVSDRQITKECGFLDKISEGDHVMADRGFTIRDLLLSKKAILNIPPFTKESIKAKKGRYLTPRDIIHTRNIASVRIHVERAIQRLKEFNILNGRINLALRPLLDQIVVIAAVLCNLHDPLIKE